MESDLGEIGSQENARQSLEKIFEEGRRKCLVSHAEVAYLRSHRDEKGLERLAACVVSGLNYLEYVDRALSFLKKTELYTPEALAQMAVRGSDLNKQVAAVSSALEYPVWIEALEKHMIPKALAQGIISKGQAEALSAISSYAVRQRELEALADLVQLKVDLEKGAEALLTNLGTSQKRLLTSAMEQMQQDLHRSPHLVRSEAYLRRFEGVLEFLTDYDKFANPKPVLAAAAQG